MSDSGSRTALLRKAVNVSAPPTLETDRLILRRPKSDDPTAIFERYASDPDVTRYLGWPRHRGLEETRAFLELSNAEWERWPAGPYLITSRVDGSLLGSTGLGFEAPYRASTGYVLARDAWGRGYATEALRAVVELAATLGVRRLYALCHPDHGASSRVLEKCGFDLEATLRCHTEFPNLQPGIPTDVLCYASVLSAGPTRSAITIRHMAASELDRIGEIDRSERVMQEYSYRSGSLGSRIVDLQVPTWSRTGDHEHSVQGMVNAWQPILDRGGTLVGAFDAASLVGFAIYQPHLAERMANLVALYVSRNYRRKGTGSALAAEVARLARAGGARCLYVSATPSGPTVEFYRSHGFEPTDEPNEVLFAAEPNDIHMILKL